MCRGAGAVSTTLSVARTSGTRTLRGLFRELVCLAWWPRTGNCLPVCPPCSSWSCVGPRGHHWSRRTYLRSFPPHLFHGERGKYMPERVSGSQNCTGWAWTWLHPRGQRGPSGTRLGRKFHWSTVTATWSGTQKLRTPVGRNRVKAPGGPLAPSRPPAVSWIARNFIGRGARLVARHDIPAAVLSNQRASLTGPRLVVACRPPKFHPQHYMDTSSV